MEQKQGSRLQLPQRPAISSNDNLKKISREIQLQSNLFLMQVQANSNDQSQSNNLTSQIESHLYDVKFNPAVSEDNRHLRYKILKVNQRNIENLIGRFVFSGNMLYSIIRFNDNVLEQFEHTEGQVVEGVRYSIRLKYVKTISIDQKNASLQDNSVSNLKQSNVVTQTINVIMKNHIRQLNNYVEIGRNSKFFDLNSKENVEVKDRQENVLSILECYKGFAFGVIPTRDKLYLLSDYACRILREETALDFLRRHNNTSLWNDLIAGQSVITEYNNFQTYKIDRIDQTKTPRSTFLYRETNLQISFQEYYRKVYRIQIRNLNQPLLVHIRKYREANTNVLKQQEIYLIPELCKMTGLTDEQRSNYPAMEKIAKHTKLNPLQRLRQSQNISELLSSQVQASGLRINSQQSTVNAIQLNSPQITFGGQRVINVNNGKFDMRAPIFDRLDFDNWILYHHKKDQAKAQKFVQTLQRASQAYGIKVLEPQYVNINTYSSRDWIREIDNDFSNNEDYQFVLTFGATNPRLYQDLKKFLNVEVGIESQNVDPDSLKKNEMSVVSKIALQIASKLGKRIWKVQIPQGINPHTMIIGIETSIKRLKQSQCIGVVASINQDFTKYFSDVDIRQSNDNALPTLSRIIKNAIAAYSKNTKNLPQEVIVYRQGLGEGQIQQSMNIEIQAIQNGFQLFNKDFKPRLAFFQVNKKVGQKFYLETPRGSQPISNPDSGTIVAREVVQNNFEFFMAAQNCNSGVCTPTKYTCLFNNTNLSEDTFWQFTYFQTFNYYNWQGPVRVPAAMKYAEKLAKFVSEVLQTSSHDYLTNSLFYL